MGVEKNTAAILTLERQVSLPFQRPCCEGQTWYFGSLWDALSSALLKWKKLQGLSFKWNQNVLEGASFSSIKWKDKASCVSFRFGDLICFSLHKKGKIYLTYLTKYPF